jgi:hypothetical protein
MASHLDYKVLNANEILHYSWIPSSLHALLMVPLRERKPKSIAYLLGGSEHMYWFEPWRWSALNMSFVDKQPARMQGQSSCSSQEVQAIIFGRV